MTVEAKKISSATIHVTADNSYCVKVNGNPAAEGEDFRVVAEADIAALLRPGANRIEIEAVNGGECPNPAGLVALVRVSLCGWPAAWRFPRTVAGRRRWPRTRPMPAGLRHATSGRRRWGRGGRCSIRAPSRIRSIRPTGRPRPCLAVWAGWRTSRATVPSATRIVRRRACDLYFVANREARTVEAECTFRVAGRKPECWDPLTGRIRDLPDFRGSKGRTTVPLRFEPHQSYFIVFRQPAEAIGCEGGKELRCACEGGGDPRAVGGAFRLQTGRSGAVTFETLDDWSKRPEEGIRYYSGVATYRTRFDLPAGTEKQAGLRIALGDVRVMARVRLNGQDLGTAWCAPWSVEIGRAAKEKGNELEIDVANLWPNRLIGDQALPVEKRVTWTTWNPYQRDSALMPSGLLGPVTLLSCIDAVAAAEQRRQLPDAFKP